MSKPLVSVVTPVHDTADYLEQCIKSVLAQTYENFEYIILENQSEDGSGDIADRYASIDDRIRVVRTSELLSQVANYNFALSLISDESGYAKMCQADDWLYPRCLEEMVQLGESAPSAGVISSYYLHETEVMNVGLGPEEQLLTDGKACRLHLSDGIFLFGSPTTLMYRSDLVRSRVPFFAEGRLHEDTELCFDVLDQVDFGFVHQVLSFSRGQAGSIMASSSDLLPEALDRVIVMTGFGRRYLTDDEYAAAEQRAFDAYYGSLARRILRSVVRRTDRRFWAHQRSGLASAGQRLDQLRLAKEITKVGFEVLLCPLGTLRAARRIRNNSSTEPFAE